MGHLQLCRVLEKRVAAGPEFLEGDCAMVCEGKFVELLLGLYAIK